jgi:hypothetical protein
MHMNSEKITNRPNATKEKQQSDYLDLLENHINNTPLETLRSLLMEIAVDDKSLLYRLTARMVPMSMDDVIGLLNDAIEFNKGENALLNSNAQDQVAMITDALMKKAKEYVARGNVLAAMRVCIGILQAIEPHLEDVTDEGHILQTIMKETYSFVQALPADIRDAEEFSGVLEKVGSSLK